MHKQQQTIIFGKALKKIKIENRMVRNGLVYKAELCFYRRRHVDVPPNGSARYATASGGRYHFRGNNRLQATDGKTAFVTDPENEYRDSRLLVYYATIPVLLEYQTKINGDNIFFIYGGIEGLVKLYSKSQVDVKTPEGIRKDNYRDLNLLPLNLRFTARIGIEYFSLFGYYQPVSMFEKGKGPDVHPFGIGLMLNF